MSHYSIIQYEKYRQHSWCIEIENTIISYYVAIPRKPTNLVKNKIEKINILF